jgi:8-oxo-dGTP diphosphatase
VSSPFARCVQTLEPLALAVDLPIETTELLAEGATGAPAVALLLSLVDEQSVACCTHGDVVYEIVRAVADGGFELDGPADAPVASTWVLDVTDGTVTGGRFVGAPPH